VDEQQSVVVDAPYLLKIGVPPIAGPGEEITYTLRAINPTSETARSIRIEDEMPDSIEILEVNATSGEISINGQTIVFVQSTLLPGERVTIILLTRIREDGDPSNIVNRACLTTSLNTNPSCAEMGFFVAEALPDTGQSPVWREVMLAVFGVVLLISWRLYRLLTRPILNAM
jgi:hypothetical protein